MHNYKILSHTADVRLSVKSDTPEGLFVAALDGMNAIINPELAKRAGDLVLTKNVSIKSPDITALLIDFLSAILTYSHEERAMFYKAEIIKLENNYLNAKVWGRKIDEFKEDIKAVTYHEAEIEKNKAGEWKTVVVFDI